MALKSFRGLLLEVVGLFSSSLAMIIFKYLSDVPVDYFCFYTYLIQVFSIFPYAVCRTKITDYTVDMWSEKYTHLIRATTSGVAFLLFAISFQYVSATDAAAVAKTTPIFVTAIAYFFLKERPGWTRLAILLVSVGGVLLVCRPTFIFGRDGVHDPWSQVVGLSCALGGTICVSAIYITQRMLRRTPLSICVLVSAAINTPFYLTLVLVRSSWARVDCTGMPLMFLSGLAGLISIVLRFASSRLEEAGRLAVVSVVDLPFFMILEFFLFGTVPHWTAYVGMVLIMSCIVGLFLLKQRENNTAKFDILVKAEKKPNQYQNSILQTEIENATFRKETRV